MKRIVVYQSSTGFTAKYAGWIAEELGCEAKPFKEVKAEELAGYDTVIYGGWIMAGMVSGYDKIKALNLKNVVVFAVGMTNAGVEVSQNIAKQNQIPEEKLFYFEGGYAPERVGFVKRMMINMIKKPLEKKENKTAEDLYQLETFEGKDRTNKGAIKPLIQMVNGEEFHFC
ncbi:MAG: flavodoxin domain-containing protein [Lachnospiraceae bacterium]